MKHLMQQLRIFFDTTLATLGRALATWSHKVLLFVCAPSRRKIWRNARNGLIILVILNLFGWWFEGVLCFKGQKLATPCAVRYRNSVGSLKR